MNKEFEKIIETLESEAKRWEDSGKEYEDRCEIAVARGIKNAIEIVKQEAKQYNNGWIPCSERLPDDFMSFEYLTIRKGHTLATITYYCVVNHKWYLSRNSSKEIDVIAWKPLPEPYKERD